MAERSLATRRSLWLVLTLVLAFLYIPIAVLVALSFNEGGLPTVWSGFVKGQRHQHGDRDVEKSKDQRQHQPERAPRGG